MKIKVYHIDSILYDLETSIKNKTPFSLIRFGDGGIKFVHAMVYNNLDQLNKIIIKEGLPNDKLLEVFNLWGYFASKATYIDTPAVYFTEKFWPRIKRLNKRITKETERKLKAWKKLYDIAKFNNNNFCNPEINFLSILNRYKKYNLLDIMKNRKVCCITPFPEVKNKLSNFNIDIIKIVGHYENHYENSFNDVIRKIKETVNDYDFWLVGAGELGRIYSGFIKNEGGRAFDIGFVIEYWLNSEIPIRLMPFLDVEYSNPLMLRLKERALKYEKFL